MSTQQFSIDWEIVMTEPAPPKKRSRLNRSIRWIFIWVLLPVILIHLAILIFQPEQKMMDQLFSRIERDTGVRITYKEIHITAGFSMAFSGLVVEQPKAREWKVDSQTVTLEPQRYFTAETLVVGIAYQPLLKGKVGLTFNADVYQGKVEGLIETAITNAFRKTPAPLAIRPDWTGISMAELARDIEGLEYNRGIASGNAELYLDPMVQYGLSGHIFLKVDETDYTMPERVGGALNISLISSCSADVNLAGPEITLKEVWALGDFGSVLITGTIHREEKMDNSQLNLDVKIYPHEPDKELDPKQYIPVTIKGTVDKPQALFMGIDVSEGL